jgi:hypothetical protein
MGGMVLRHDMGRDEMTDFNRKYLEQDTFVQRRLRRDAALRDFGIDPEEYRIWARDSEIGNECDTDEYRETQPSKGLHFIGGFLSDWAPGVDACYEMFELTKKWLAAGANMGEAYSGADELKPILEMYFDFEWAQGGYSLYEGPENPPSAEWIQTYKEELAI